jgi:sulfur-oxidizing protein SoxY
LKPTRVLAATWPKAAFESKTMDEVAKSLYGSSAATSSKDIAIKAPIQAENGAVVPISVSTKLPKVEAISILVEKNAFPLVSNVELSGAEGYFSARMKMGKTSDVKVYVKSDGKLFMATQQIKVTVGGCGG